MTSVASAAILQIFPASANISTAAVCFIKKFLTCSKLGRGNGLGDSEVVIMQAGVQFAELKSMPVQGERILVCPRMSTMATRFRV
ncbi:hypothetical protein QBC38DRAFT_452573 [Podospora fimiseda]|uniref:Uncharacterized protein n=1 Tax=Podospora fimiseda TaxID=252190 RepID=A0AAN7BV01_9PEZI|nr:hypothetical protein QBC38DRAFT_452573 [Podospora fimiseda]